MRFTFALVVFFAFTLLTEGLSRSDELSDLKAQVEKLMQRIEELEKKQKDQAEAVKKVPEIAKSVDKLQKAPSASQVVGEALSKGVSIGGHLKFFLLDRTDGERNDTDQNNNLAAGVSDLYLYFRKSITDYLALDVAPHIRVNAAATPTLGNDISRDSNVSVDIDLDEAYMTLRLASIYNVEVKAGAFYPMFSEEYATKTWWHEQYNGNNGLLTLQTWRSAGLELYKNFDFEDFSMPVYLYPYLNGEDRNQYSPYRYTDNNGSKNVLLHVAPNFFAYGARIKLLGSLGYGKWDSQDDNGALQYAAGVDVKYRSFGLSGEYLSRKRNDVPLLGGGKQDGEDKGFYIRGVYTFNPKWVTVVKYSDVDLYSPGTTQMLTDNYKTLSLGVNYWIVEGVSTIMPQVEYVNAERSNGQEKLDYLRWTLGWRTTF